MKELWSSEVSEFDLKFEQVKNEFKFEKQTQIGLGGKIPAQDPGRLGSRPRGRPPLPRFFQFSEPGSFLCIRTPFWPDSSALSSWAAFPRLDLFYILFIFSEAA